MTAGMHANRWARGRPLLMLALMLTAWTGARALWWENPFAAIGDAPVLPDVFAPPAAHVVAQAEGAAQAGASQPGTAATVRSEVASRGNGTSLAGGELSAQIDPQLAGAHAYLSQASRREPASTAGSVSGGGVSGAFATAMSSTSDYAPFLPAPAPRSDVAGRWSMDAWTFWRQGSDAAPISQGRVPIYGASQVGAVAQYRLAPNARRDPRLYVRAYRAMVRRGENELALGASARPLGRVPLRVAGEVRYTDAAFTDELRPSAYAVTEFAPVALPFGTRLEAYGRAGWVGGASSTAFADGQMNLSREVRAVAGATNNDVRLSVGAGAWGGAQSDAQRLDVGPTVRIDLTVGQVPARLSLDWRERVAGQASPDSGLAATLSTSF
ncbi:MAG: hypothetical protein CVT75_11510 [Alphaproteobacteria bacterium HGW-Alphaproteobacteria-14]|nr:MAG: hypothetical protein CVT75_11510 [Alphaproteobacteria bacterium HGW-Alphaproteobacteria-14]